MSTQKSGIGRVFSALWSMINTTRKIIINLLFFTLLVVFVAALSSEEDQVVIEKESALVLNLKGVLVEQLTAIDPISKFVEQAAGEEEENPEVLVSDVIQVLSNAKEDNRIKAVILDLQGLRGGGLNKLNQIGDALNAIKTAGKPIYAIGDYYSQSQYFLASYADDIYLNPMGIVMIDGFGSYKNYFKSALEKLKITTHVFRVGTFKSAVEPFLRDDMSDAAKTANKAWIDELWLNYKTAVAARRDISTDNFDENLDAFKTKISSVDGDFGAFAIKYGWVDKLAHRNDIRADIAKVVGWNKKKTSFNQVSFNDYLSTIKPPITLPPLGDEHIAIVVAKGTILDGNQKAGSIGGDSTAKLLQKARLDDNVKAVVLRIDSPGGSAFASEVIRKEVDLLQAEGKPVVASMSSVAASGGYWIAASTDQIWASPTTITGSIGIFGMFMTFENAMQYLGIGTDGVGTTEWAGLGVTTALDERMKDIIQMNIERGYDRFISLVAAHRDMTKAQVDKVAQGRVWTGKQAQALGLVDQLGDLDDAIAAAAALAKLDKYESKLIERDLSSQELFIKELLGQTQSWIGTTDLQPKTDNNLRNIVNRMIKEYNGVARLNDPKGMYALCVACPM